MFTQPFHVFDNHNASLSDGGALAVVVRDFSETPHGTRDNTDFPRPMRDREARRRLACPPSPGATARRTRGGLVEGATPFLPFKVRHRAGMTIAHQIAHFSSPFRAGGRSLYSDPCGKAVESAKKPTAKNSRPQMALRPRRARLEDAHNPISPIRTRAACYPA